MTDVGRFGVFLPSYVWEGDGPERARGIKTFARTVEELGFDSLFITDHLLAARRFYSVNWLEPLTTLAVAAGATERVRLGTSILIMPLRNPVILAKELATLQFLSDNRVDPRRRRRLERRRVRGGRRAQVGTRQAHGRDARHHDAAARGRDESPTTVRSTTSTTCSSNRGRRSGRCCGSVADRSWPIPKSPDVPRFVESVKARTVRADGWIPRPTCPPPDIARDWEELQAAFREAGRDPTDSLVAHENFLHLVLTNDPAKAREEQHRAFLKVMSSERGPDYLESVYLFGTPDEVIASLQARVDAGVEYFFLHTMTPDPAQLQQWVDEIIPNVTFPATAGPVRRTADPLAMTRRVGLLGKPLKRRHSQVMHDAAFDAAGIDARYVLLELEPDAVGGRRRERRAGQTGSGSG